ncbi:MAG: hypothetical protein ABI112_02940 [Terracoccus sp.]
MTPAPRGSDVESEVAAALRRIAGETAPERVAPDGDGLARAAITEAAGIRRHRRLAGLAAAAAAVAAIALPVALRAGPSTPVPAGSIVTSASPPVAAPVVRATARVTAGLPAPLGSVASPVSYPVVRPYVVGGVYHGESGTLRLGNVAELRGLVDVLNLAGGARVLRLEPPGGPASTVVQSADGGVVLRLPGVSGPTVADASGKRFAMLDLSVGSLTLRDERGKLLERTSAPNVRSVAGFAGDRVLVTTDRGSALWDLASGSIASWATGQALDASDTASAALLLTGASASGPCWSVRSTVEGSARSTVSHCGPAAPFALTADGRYVLAQDKPPNEASRAVVLDALTGGTVLAVTVAEGATVTQTGFRIGLDELVLGVVARDGESRLVGCTLNGRCQSLTSTVPGSTSIDPHPYLLVRD